MFNLVSLKKVMWCFKYAANKVSLSLQKSEVWLDFCDISQKLFEWKRRGQVLNHVGHHVKCSFWLKRILTCMKLIRDVNLALWKYLRLVLLNRIG